MLKRLKNILVLLITLLLAGGVYMWFYPLNKGALKIMTGMTSYFIIEGENQTLCETDPCEIVLKSGSYHLEIRKDGYITESINVPVKRGRTDEVAVTLKKIPTLQPIEIAPEQTDKNRELPEALRNRPLIAPAWDPSGEKLVFWDPEDEKVKLWDKSGIMPVAALKNMKEDLEWHWSPDASQLAGILETDIYFIDIKRTSRKKIITPFLPLNLTWSPAGSYLLANDSKNELYKIEAAERTIEAIGQTLDLGNAVWEDGDTLIYFTYNEEKNESLIESFSVSDRGTRAIMRKTDFKIEKVLAERGGMIYFYSPAETNWYQLTY
ncbi:PEGA domain-containing protein [Candidatus Peregrinibacteria bacterium]|nr:PEGA domain-containing protein [Candidatus Peregrinibacteria bacterium]